MDNNTHVNYTPSGNSNNPPIKPKRIYAGFESAYAWICVLIGYLFCRAFPPTTHPLGFFIVNLLCISTSFFVLSKKGLKFDIISILSAVLSLVFAFSYIVTDDSFVGFFTFICSLVFYCYFVYSSSGNRFEGKNRDILPLELFRAMKCTGGDGVFSAISARKNRGFKSFLKIALGLFVAIFPTVIIIGLLSFDSEFMDIIYDVLDLLFDINIFSHIISLAFGLVIAMYLFGVYYANYEKRAPLNYEKIAETGKKLRIAPALTVAAALFPILAVYVIFFISQRYYYVSAFTGVLPSGVESYAEYARNGFFELCAVSAINLVALIVVSVFLRRNNTAQSVFLRVITIIVSLMTLVLIGTAMSKMALYIKEYGLTQKRVLSSWFMVLLTFVFILIILSQFISKIKLISTCTAVVIVMTALLGLSNYKTLIADYNVERYISGDSENLDAIALAKLGPSAVPAMTRLADYWDEQFEIPEYYGHEHIHKSLRQQKEKLSQKEGVFTFSIPDQRARNALEKYYEKHPINYA
ncbi:MAG: DUF4173 domain-containing protein [Clostridia bacterium]|nr:DUF4173 domain-containing protein [Clostridia bacterium]